MSCLCCGPKCLYVRLSGAEEWRSQLRGARCVQRWRCTQADAGSLTKVARELSMGGQESCHPQIIKKIENRNFDIGQSMNERSKFLLNTSVLGKNVSEKNPSVKISCVVFLEQATMSAGCKRSCPPPHKVTKGANSR